MCLKTFLNQSTPEINIESTDDEKFKLVEDFISKADYKDANSVLIDGVRVEFDFGWGLLRASNTSPVLVLRFEADTQENLESIKNTFRRTLNEIKPNLGNFQPCLNTQAQGCITLSIEHNHMLYYQKC